MPIELAKTSRVTGVILYFLLEVLVGSGDETEETVTGRRAKIGR